MTQNRRSWLFVIVFWLLFVASIGLDGHYPWVNTAWVYAALLFAIVVSVFSLAEMFRHRNASGHYVYFRGVPRCMRWFVLDDKEYARDTERQKLTEGKSLTPKSH